MSAEPDTLQGSPTKSRWFRPDIQGIRALAVLLVIVNHLVPGQLPGGYVGVDVFFVVSGYLITALLLGESARTGRISLGGFYARRARRILPAATVVTVVTVVVSLLTLPLLRVQTILTDAVWATFFAANVRMAETGTDYFAIGQPPSPLRHYWSLAVEEQFYLVWPLLLLACLAVVHARGRSDRDLRRVAGALVLIIVAASLAWSVWATHVSPVTAYFSTLARAWELGIGAACAIFARRSALAPAARQVLALLGLAAVAIAALRFSDATSFPGLAALLPVLGTAALIVAGDGGGSTVTGRLLATRPMVVVGDWSYSLYLWHWPVIVLLRSNLGPERFGSVAVRLFTLVLIFVLSWASFRWIETPFRHGVWRRRSRALLIYPVSIAMVLATVIISTQVVRYELGEWSDEPAIAAADYRGQELGKDPYVALVRASALAAEQGRPVPSDLTPRLLDLREQTAPLGDCDYRTGTTVLCPVGDPDADRTIVVLGDSHARALAPAVEKIGEEHGYRVYVLVYSGCSATSLVQIDRQTRRVWDACEDFKDWAQETIASLHPDLLVVSTSAGVVIDPETGDVTSPASDPDRYAALLEEGWTSLFTDLATSADRVVLVGNTPKLPREPGVCLSQGRPDLGECAFPAGRQFREEAGLSFAAAAAAGVDSVDAAPWFCADGICPAVVGRFITMRDSEHMTPDYARWLATPLAVALGVGPPVAQAGATGRDGPS
jgi:peptidoglycan/LPS O-acetylase OafA/YrhL